MDQLRDSVAARTTDILTTAIHGSSRSVVCIQVTMG